MIITDDLQSMTNCIEFTPHYQVKCSYVCEGILAEDDEIVGVLLSNHSLLQVSFTD